MAGYRNRGGGVLLFAAGILGAVYLLSDHQLNRPAPDFSLREASGGRVDLASYRGQPVLLVFWMTSCGICRQELPLLSRVAPDFRSKGVTVMAVHVGNADDIRDYIQTHHIGLTSLTDGDGQVATAYHVTGVPKTVLIGSDGKIFRSHAGMTDEDTLREWLSDVAR
jgi:peroxiredoxin